jgi:hypothetical protein
MNESIIKQFKESTGNFESLNSSKDILIYIKDLSATNREGKNTGASYILDSP